MNPEDFNFDGLVPEDQDRCEEIAQSSQYHEDEDILFLLGLVHDFAQMQRLNREEQQ